MRRVLAALLVLLLAGAPARAFTSNTGASTAQFLRLGIGARALGMGEAYSAVAEGPSALYWNPAGLATIERPQIEYSHVEMLDFFHHEHLAYIHPLARFGGTLGASFTMFYQDSLDLVTNANQKIGTFRPHSEAYTLAYARSFNVGDDHRVRDKRFFQDMWSYPGTYRPLDHSNELWVGEMAAGGSIKLISETLYNRTASAVAFDGGILFRHVDFPQLSLSAGFRNLGSRPKFNSTREGLPVELDFGAALGIGGARYRLIAALEAGLPYYGDPYGKIGFEVGRVISDSSAVAVRAGYKSLTAQDLSPITGLTAGLGLTVRRVDLDFAFQPMAELGAVYRGSLGFRF